ncbi:Protein CBG19916 [Caenorhabditis briggsae]|uniref:Protein CBG19916 n=1 Tax=Caenorhabditis briggsae TaxID=6238 RepID=A8XWQ7_CAEBR|nr:Protein CBG19916 [Caenorhabditis briggsae]CAP37076.2 Protein CBG19916 [Caenorhabditis briggsae]
MILSKYPGLVQNEIFRNMEFSELLLLSLVSKNMEKLIKSSQKKRLKSINKIVYFTDGKNHLCVYIPREPDVDVIMRFEEFEKTEIPDFQLNVSEKIIDFRLFTRERNKDFWLPETGFHPYPVACVHKSDKESIIESVHNYFLDFFGNSTYYWKADFFGGVQYYFPTHLQNVSFCMSTYVADDFKMRNLENFFSSSPVLKSVQLFTSNSELSFNPESKFYQAESIDTIQDSITIPDILNHFQGKQAFMECKECKIWNLINFVKKWKSGEAFRKLEYLKVTVSLHEFNEIIIQNIIGVKYIDANKQPPTHTLPRV